MSQQSSVLKALKDLKRKDKRLGLYDRLGTARTLRVCFDMNCAGNLGTIADKYDCAVTTACGALNNIVVDTVEDAQVTSRN